MNTQTKLIRLLRDSYGVEADSLRPMTVGVGGDTYLVRAQEGNFVFKVMDSNEMNHPEEEPALCGYLRQNGIPASRFFRNRDGSWLTGARGRVCHLQAFAEGSSFPMNTAPEWFMEESPRLLARIHTVLRGYKPLAVGIGGDFFRYMTPERAARSYRQSYEQAEAQGEAGILAELRQRIELLELVKDWHFEPEKLTCCNSHGDFTVNQILCAGGRIQAVIDWTSACIHPVVWEITRSFFYADSSCGEGSFDADRFAAYVSAYASAAPLNDYDRENILKVYYYQLAVCDYYAQYLSAPPEKKQEYLQQARFATAVLRNARVS